MADAKRTVVIDIQVTNNINESLSSILGNLKSFAKDVSKIQEGIKSFADSFKEIKVSKSVRDTISAITELGKVQIPDIKPLVKGLTDLSKASEKIKGPEAFSAVNHLATALKSIEGMKIPDISRLFRGMQGIGDFKGVNQLKFNLEALKEAIKPLQEKTALPGLLTLSKGLQDLIKTTSRLENLDKLHNTLLRVKNSIIPLQGLKFPSVTGFVDGLSKLSGLKDIGNTGNIINSLVSAMGAFKGVQFPGVNAFVKGLDRLVKLDVAPVTAKILELAKSIQLIEKSGQLKAFATFAKDLNAIGTQLGAAIPGLIKVQNAIKGVGEASRQASGHTKGFGERLMNYMQYRVIADTIFKMQDAFFGTIRVIREFDQALFDLKAITGATDAETAKMGQTIIGIASKSKYSATEVAEGMKILGQAGFTAAETIQAIGPITDLATGTLESLGNTVDVVSSIMTVFNMDASETAHIVDVLANAINKSKLDVDKLRTAFNYVGPTAAEANISFEETSAAMMVLGNAGLRASTIGTSLRRLFSDLVDPSDKFKAAIERAGYTVDDFNPQLHSIQEIFPKLNLVVRDAGEAFNIFGKLGANAVLTLKESGNGFQEMLGHVNKVGSAAEMAAIQTQGLDIMYKNLINSTQLLGVAIGDAGLTGFLKGLVVVMKGLVDAVSTLLTSGFGKLAVTGGLLFVSMGGVLGIIAKLVDSFRILKDVMFLNTVKGAEVVAKMMGMNVASVMLIKTYQNLGSTIVTALTSATNAFKAFFFSSSLLSGVFAVAIVPLMTWAGLLVSAIASIDDFAEAAEKAAQKAVDFSLLQNGMVEYQKNIAVLSEDTEQYKQANLGLQKELYKTANGNSELSNSALVAAQSIDPLNGKILDGGEALKAYQKQLNDITLASFVEAYANAAKNIENQTTNIAQGWEGFKNTFVRAGDDIKRTMGALFNKGDISDNIAQVEKESAKIRLGEGIAQSMKDGLDKGKVTFKEFSDYIQKIRQEGMIDKIPAQQDLLKMFNLLNQEATNLFTQLVKTGQVDATSTVDSFKKITDNFNLTEKQLEAINFKFAEFQESIKKAGSLTPGAQLAKEFESGKQSLTNFYDEYRKTGNVITDQEDKNIQAIIARKKALAEEYTTETNKYTEKLQGGKLTEEDVKERIKWEKEWNEKLVEINKASFENFKYHSLGKIQAAKEQHEKELALIEASGKQGLALKEAIAKAELELQKKIQQAVENPYTVKEVTEKYQTERKAAQLAGEQRLHDIALLEAQSVDIHVETERAKYQATLDTHNKTVQLAKEELAKIRAASDKEPKDVSNAEQRLLEEEKKRTEFLRKEVIDRKKEETQLNADIDDLWNKMTKQYKLNAVQREKDNKEHLDNIEQNEKDLVKKLKDLEDKKKENIRKATEDIDKIRKESAAKAAEELATGEEKTRLINQRGMSDKQKDADNKKTAWTLYNKARQMMDEAVSKKDQSMLESAIDKFKKSQDLGGDLKSKSAAKELTNVNANALFDAQKALGKLKEDERNKELAHQNSLIDKDAKTATDESEEKKQSIIKKRQETIDAENERHNIEQANHDREMGKLQQKLQITQEMLRLMKEYASTSQSAQPAQSAQGYGKVTTESGKVITEGFKQPEQKTGSSVTTEQKVDVKFVPNTLDVDASLEATKNKAVGVGRDFGDSLKAGAQGAAQAVTDETAQAAEIAKNGYRIIFENGKMIATNLTDSQRQSIQVMAEAATQNARNSFANITADSKSAWEQAKEDAANTFGEPVETEVVVNQEQIETAKTNLTNMDAMNVSIDVDAQAQAVDDVYGKVKEVDGETITITAELKESEEFTEAVEGFSELEDKEKKKLEVETKGGEEVAQIKTIIDSIVDKIVNVTANVTGMDSVVALKNAIDNLHDKTITITQIVRKVEENAVGGLIQKFADGGSPFKRLQSRYINQGSGTKDDVPAMLMKDEFVHRSAAVKKYGVDFMYKLNNLLIPKSVVQMFNKGGVVSNLSSGVVQMFNKGGSVLGLARKKIEEFFGISSVNLNLGSMQVHNEIKKTADEVTTPIGTKAVDKMSENFQSIIAQFATGGYTSGKSILSIQELDSIRKNYSAQIALASRNGQTQIVRILEKERDEILNLSKTLEEQLKNLEEEYMLKAELQDKIAKGEISEVDADYQLQKRADEQEFNEQIESDNKQFAMDDLSYFQEKESKELEYKKNVDETKADTKKEMEDYNKNLAEKLKELNEFVEKDKKQRERWATFWAFPKKEGSALYTAPLKEVLEQYHRFVMHTEGKIQQLGPISQTSVKRSLEKYAEKIGDPWKKAQEEYNKLVSESPKKKEQEKLTELKVSYDNSLAEQELERSNQVMERALAIVERDKSYKQKRMEAEFNYAIAKREEKENAKKEGEQVEQQYQEQSSSVKSDFATRMNSVRERSLTQVDEVRRSTASNLDTINNAFTVSPVKRAGFNVDDFLRRLGKGILRFNSGGFVPFIRGARQGVDSIIAALTPKEYVLNEHAVSHYGKGLFDMFNNLQIPTFNTGGAVSQAASALGSSSTVVHALDLTVNGANVGQLNGDSMTIENWIDAMNTAMRMS